MNWKQLWAFVLLYGAIRLLADAAIAHDKGMGHTVERWVCAILGAICLQVALTLYGIIK